MAEVRFYLEKRKDKATGDVNRAKVPILLFYSFESKRLQYYTGERIDAAKWDETAMRVKKNVAEASEINKELNRLVAKVEEIHTKASVLGERLSPEYFKDRLSGRKKEAKNGDLIWPYYQEYLDSLKVTHAAKSIIESTNTRRILKEYSQERRRSMTFDSIDQHFWEDFFDWCYHTRDYNNNYTGTHIDKFKAFLNWSVKRGYNTFMEFRKQRRMWENTEIIYLTYEELQKFLKCKLKDQLHRYVRDMYCLGAFTGLRYSDVIRLQPMNIVDDQIHYRVKKTKQPNIIPLNKYSRMLLDRNKGLHPTHCMPYVGGNVNGILKGAMKEAGLNRMVQIVHFQGAERKEETKPLWDAATFHTSKKTFITNFLERGGSLTTAMAITGNKSFKVIKRYFKIADSFKAREMARIFGK